MAFISGWIRDDEDKKYVASKGFKDIFGRPLLPPLSWAIDREKDIILVSRGGGGPEIPEGYALYIGGDIINIEGYERNEGNRFENNLKINWIINKIEADKRIIQNSYDNNAIIQYIKKAFEAYGKIGLRNEQIIDVEVQINCDINIRGEKDYEYYEERV